MSAETWAALLIAAACLATMSSGVLFTTGPWYTALAKPRWKPPGGVIGPAWVVLFSLMGYAAWSVWRLDGLGWPLALFLAHLPVNWVWSWLMFGRRRIDLAAKHILFLWGAILAVVLGFATVSLFAAALLVPYLCWVGYAAALNRAIVRLNPRSAYG